MVEAPPPPPSRPFARGRGHAAYAVPVRTRVLRTLRPLPPPPLLLLLPLLLPLLPLLPLPLPLLPLLLQQQRVFAGARPCLRTD